LITKIGSRADRPMVKIDLTGLNLAHPRGNDAFKLHDGLRDFNRVVFKNEPLDFDKYTSRAHGALFNIGFGLGFRHADEKVKDAMREVANTFKEGRNDKIRTPSTYLMQRLGYDGVDVRGGPADNGTYGSVIYPKPRGGSQ